MRAPTLFLAAVIALFLVVQRTDARPGSGGGAAFVKSEKSASNSNFAAGSSSSDQEEIKTKSACGDEFSKKSSSSSTSSVSKSASSSSESFEAYQAGSICGETLEAKKCGETDIAYYTRIFQVDASCSESVKTFYSKVFKQYKGETDEAYVKRVNFIFTQVYTKLDCRYNEKYVSYLEKYYKISYAKKSAESETEYFKRVLTKTSESESVYKVKVTILKKYITEVNWSKVKIDAKSCTGYSLSTEEISTAKSLDTTKSCGCTKSITAEEIKKTYARKEKEDESTYFSRIITKQSSVSTEEYIKTLTAVRKEYPKLSLWYDTKYVNLVKQYYTATYTKISSETEETYFKRIVTKESFEDDVQCAQRVAVLRELFPNLSLWSDERYYETYTKKVYQTVYKKSTTEDETTYFKRIITQTTGESDTVYINRLNLLKRTYSGLSLWYSKKYLSQITKYYTSKYTKQSSEKEETFFQRIVTKESLETDEQCAERVEVVRELFPNLALWHQEKYYETYTKKFYETFYKKSSSEDEITYYKRIVTKSTKESDETYIARLNLIEKTYRSLPLWYEAKYFDTIKPFYTLKYAKRSGESDEAYFTRIITTKDVCDTTTEIYAQRLHLVQLFTASSAVWYDEKYYEKYTKSYYASYFKKTETETSEAWLTRVFTLLPGECNESAIKRITLIKKAVSGCGCWTQEALTKIESTKVFTSEYIALIKKTFFVAEFESKSSSSSSSSKSASSSSSEDIVEVRRG